MAALAQHLYPLHEIADGPFERHDRVARRKIGQASAHSFHFGAHGLDGDRSARIGSLAAHIVELKPQGPNVVEQGLRERRRRFRAAFGRRTVRPRTDVERAGLSAAGALLELVAPHGDLRHRRLEIKGRLRIERCRREAVAAPLAILSDVGQACPDRFEPPHSVDERAAVAVSRHVVPL